MSVTGLTESAVFIALFLVIFFIAKIVKDFLTPYKINEELSQKDNVAIALTMCGYYFGVAVIFIGAVAGNSTDLVNDVIQVSIYSALGLLLLNTSRVFNDKVLLRRFCNDKQLMQEHNVAVGAVQFGSYVATGLIAAGAITGEGGGLLSAVVFFVLGQLSLFVFSLIYDVITPYCIHDELKNKNTAAGIALGGTMIALAIIICGGGSDDFNGWYEGLLNLALVNVFAFLFLPTVRFVLDKCIVTGSSLCHEIAKDNNLGIGLLEATVCISFAIVIAVLV